MVHVKEINEIEQLAGYRLLWASLLTETRDANFFQSLDWLSVYWRHYGREQRLRVLIVSVDGTVIGILPLVVRRRGSGIAAARVLTYPLDDWGTFYGPIGPNPAATLQAGMAHIHRTRRDWDFIDLRWVGTDTTDHGRTATAMKLAGLEPTRSRYSQVALVQLQGTWAEYVARRGHKWRVNQSRCERKVAEVGHVTYVRHRPEATALGGGDPAWHLYETCERIAARSWQGSSQTGTTLSHESIRAFLRDAHQVAAHAGAVDMSLLYLDEQPVAFIYNYHYRGHVFGLRRGFDANVVNAGAGNVILGRTIEDSFARGDHTFDLGAEYLDSKRPWSTAIVESDDYTHLPLLGVKAQAVRLKRAADRWFAKPEVAPTTKKARQSQLAEKSQVAVSE